MLHGLMVLALLACFASLIQTSLTRSQPCPECGTLMRWIDKNQRLSADDNTWRLLDMFRCDRCGYDVVLAAWDPDPTETREADSATAR
jgi:hypothetical protein